MGGLSVKNVLKNAEYNKPILGRSSGSPGGAAHGGHNRGTNPSSSGPFVRFESYRPVVCNGEIDQCGAWGWLRGIVR